MVTRTAAKVLQSHNFAAKVIVIHVDVGNSRTSRREDEDRRRFIIFLNYFAAVASLPCKQLTQSNAKLVVAAFRERNKKVVMR